MVLKTVKKIELKEKFWARLASEVEEAQNSECCFLLQMDCNAHLGSSEINGDPCSIDQNGAYFKNFLNKFPHLTLVNSMPLTEGSITRRRITVNKVEESIIDFFVVCDRLLPYIQKLLIDEQKKICPDQFL